MDRNKKIVCVVIFNDDAEKSPVSHTVFALSKQHLRNKKREDLTESTGVVPAKFPPKVKLEFLTTLECQSWGQLCLPSSARVLSFYSSRGLTSFP